MKLFIIALFMATVMAELLGKWKNELGSTMTINNVIPADKKFVGIYETAVSANGTHLTAPLDGKYTLPVSPGFLGTITFSVNWEYKNAKGELVRSATVWAGFYTENNINAQWLLVRGCIDIDVWSSTMVGKDVFFKLK